MSLYLYIMLQYTCTVFWVAIVSFYTENRERSKLVPASVRAAGLAAILVANRKSSAFLSREEELLRINDDATWERSFQF
jgi:hypothetical protein